MTRAKRKLSQPSSPVEPPTAAATLVKCRGQWSESHKELWEQGLLLGASIQTDQGRVIRAHISVLVAHSPYIRGLLTSGLAESSVAEGTEQQISLLDVDHSAMAAIVACLYSGEISLTTENVVPVMETANMLQIAAIEEAACEYFVGRIQPDTACAALAFSDQRSQCGSHGQKLHRQCTAYVLQNFAKCVESEGFLELGSEPLQSLIGNDRLNTGPDEGVVLSAVRRWVEHKKTHEQQVNLEVLLPLIRFPLLPDAMKLTLNTDPLLKAVPSSLSLQLMMECFACFSKTAEAARCPRLKPRAEPWLRFDTVLFRDASHPAPAAVGQYTSRLQSAGYKKRIVALGGEVLRPTPAQPLRWTLTLEKLNVVHSPGSPLKGGSDFVCVGVIANPAPDAAGATQKDKTFYGWLSNSNNPMECCAGRCGSDSDSDSDDDDDDDDDDVLDRKGFYFAQGDVLEFTLTTASLAVSRQRNNVRREVKVDAALQYRVVVMWSSDDDDMVPLPVPVTISAAVTGLCQPSLSSQ
eukprot:COSAG05_NODE_1525_length_4637_cov_17.254958_5_plen_522_part_00